MQKTIFICHPWRGNNKSYRYNNYQKLTKKVCRYISLHSNNIPLSTGLYLNQFLNDENKIERNLGIRLGHKLMKKCDIVYSYEMHGISPGMKEDLKFAQKIGKPIRRISKYPWKT